MGDADRGPRREPLLAVEVEDQVGEAVDHPRLLGEAVDRVDIAVDLEPAGDDVEAAELTLDRAEDVQRRELRRRDGLLDRDLAADLPERAAPALERAAGTSTARQAE
jgi:hypothetical protein